MASETIKHGAMELDLTEVRTLVDLTDLLECVNALGLFPEGVRVMLVQKPVHLVGPSGFDNYIRPVVLRIEWDE